MRAYVALTTALIKSTLREPVSFFFLIIFSPALLLFLGIIFGSDPAPEFGGLSPIENMTPGLVIMSILIIGTSAIPQAQVMLRTSGALTRLRMTPLRASTYYAADMTMNTVFGLIGPLLTVLLAMVAFDVRAPQNLLLVVLTLLLGLVALLAFGYTFAALCPSVGAATGLGNMFMIILMLTSGAFVPIATLSDDVQRIFHFSPSFHLAQLMRQSWDGEAWSTTSVAVLVGMAAAFGVAAVLLARRQKA